MSPAVWDSSALLAWIRNEPGADRLAPDGAVMSAVNWSETAQKIAQRGGDPAQTLNRVSVAGVRAEVFTAADALKTAALWEITKSAGLSLADRACLALAQRLELPALTTDQAWSILELPVDVRLLRCRTNDTGRDS